MCQIATPEARRGALLLLAVALPAAHPVFAQQRAEGLYPDVAWRAVGNTVIEAAPAGPAGGPVAEVWYAPDGRALYVRTAAGKVFLTRDFETWEPAAEAVREPSAVESAPAVRLPEPAARLRAGRPGTAALYAVGRSVYRSEDGGLTWTDVASWRGRLLIGGPVYDLAVSPSAGDEIAVATRFGVWRSIDGGRSWAPLNAGLPNLPVRRLLELPAEGAGIRILVEGVGVFEWAPGERFAWRPARSPELEREEALRRRLAERLNESVTAAAAAGAWIYAGTAGGRLLVSADGGDSWRSFRLPGSGPVEEIFVVAGSPQTALAALGRGAGESEPAPRVLRTTNGGIFWDDITADLPGGAAHGITADPATGAVYVATDSGLFYTRADLSGASPPGSWTLAPGPWRDAAVYDVRLDAGGNQLYVAVDGEGVYARMAPHRFRSPAVVSAADLRAREAAPGALLTVLGGLVTEARAGALPAPLLAATGRESQIQIPFEVAGDVVALGLTLGGRPEARSSLSVNLPLADAAPAILEDRDGAPMILDADSGVLLNALTPARPGSRLQILATGLGRTEPPWPAGLAAPLENPPKAALPVRVYLDRQPLEAVRAVLAPGYIGFYLVEFIVPPLVNAGPAELYIEAGGRVSNRTRIYLEP